jgi:PadR family transcriptional regulator PadR
MRRKRNALVPLEVSILQQGVDLRGRGLAEFHGFLIAKKIKERAGARLLTAYGTLYKALERMERAGLLVSRWEDPVAAAAEHRLRRRLYRVTPSGEAALAAAPPVKTQRRAKFAARPVVP